MKNTARAAQKLGVGVVNGFTGSSIWHLLYSFPPVPQQDDRRRLQAVRRALEPDPRRVRRVRRASSRWKSIRPRSPSTSTPPSGPSKRSATARSSASTSIPATCIWQGVDPVEFIRAFPDRIYHVHVKDAIVTLNGRTRHPGQPPQLRRPAPRLGLPLPGPRRRELRGDHPRPERSRLPRPALGRVGRQRHGPRARRPRSLPSSSRSSTSRRAAARSTRRLRISGDSRTGLRSVIFIKERANGARRGLPSAYSWVFLRRRWREAPNRNTLSILVAASANDAVKEIAREFEKQSGAMVKISGGPSQVLANQIIQVGAAHLFLSANEEWAKKVDERRAGVQNGAFADQRPGAGRAERKPRPCENTEGPAIGRRRATWRGGREEPAEDGQQARPRRSCTTRWSARDHPWAGCAGNPAKPPSGNSERVLMPRLYPVNRVQISAHEMQSSRCERDRSLGHLPRHDDLGRAEHGKRRPRADRRGALEHGINFFDTAEMYPVPPRRRRRAAPSTSSARGSKNRGRRRRSRHRHASRGAGRREWIRGGETASDARTLPWAIDDSLKRLQTDCIDLYQIHWPERYVPAFGSWQYDPSKERDAMPILEQIEAMGARSAPERSARMAFPTRPRGAFANSCAWRARTACRRRPRCRTATAS